MKRKERPHQEKNHSLRKERKDSIITQEKTRKKENLTFFRWNWSIFVHVFWLS